VPSLGVTDSNTPYNWHPAVHSDKFGETLYFLMLRLREPLHTPVSDQVRSLLQAAGIQFACEYVIFGWWDALIRVWLTPSAYNRLARLMTPAPENNIDEFHGFTATQIHYLWSGNDADLLAHKPETLTAIAANTEAIDATAADPHHSNEKFWSALETDHLILPRSQPGNDGVKFYTSLQRTSQKMSVEEDVVAIKEAMVIADMAETGSLYVGAGTLADYMVRCAAKTFDDVLSLVASFDEALKSTRLRPMTLLIANTNARESDHVNDPAPLTLEENTDLEILGLEDAAPLVQLQPSHRLALHGLIIKACQLPGNDHELRAKLLKSLRASVLNDFSELRETLSFLLDFEHYFRTQMINEWTEVFGNDWFNVIRSKCEADPRWQEHAEKMKQPIPKWTLGTYKFTALACSSFSPEFKARIERELGENWAVETDNHLPIRNALSHSSLVARRQINSFDAEWVDFLDRAMSAALLCRRCMPDESDNEGVAL
jgi:hypothetical protein